MSLDYCAANYFIEALCNSSSHSITYDYMKFVKSLVNKEVAAYLNKKSQNDELYIFKKFPDVFVLGKDSVALTDAFLSLYNFLRSMMPTQFFKKRDYLETSALLYFSSVLQHDQPQHYVSLFNVLASDETEQFAGHFRGYSTKDAYKFFESHPDVFLLVQERVSLKTNDRNVITNSLVSDKVCPETFKEFRECVYFLLSCFQSLHYIELKQCVTYVITKNNYFLVLDRYPLIKQREWFERLPLVIMDKLGFLSLKNVFSDLAISDMLQTLLVIVCVLAFEKEMHFQKLVEEVNHRISPRVSIFCNMYVQEQLQFFLQYPGLFHVSPDENITLLSSFHFPTCIFEESKLTKIPQNRDSESNSSKTVTSEDTNSDSVHSRSSSTDLSKSGSVPKKNKMPSAGADNKDVFSSLKLSETVTQRIKVSVAFLLQCFTSYDRKCVLKTLLHVLDDVRMTFCSLPETDKQNFIVACCQFMDLEPQKRKKFTTSAMLKEVEKERILLLITLCLTGSDSMHFQNIVKLITNNEIVNTFELLSEPEQLMYFRGISAYVEIANNGYVRLNESFSPINLLVDAYFEQNKGLLPPEKKTNNKLKAMSTSQKCDSGKLPGETGGPLSSDNSSLETDFYVPEVIYKALHNSTQLLGKYFKNVLREYSLKASLIALPVLRYYFSNLSDTDRCKFVKKCYQFLYTKVGIQSDLPFSEAAIEKKDVTTLLVAYLLFNEKRLHFQRIVRCLIELGINSPLCLRNASSQFKYFKHESQCFSIQGDGFVVLDCDAVNAIAAAMDATSKTSSKVKNQNEQQAVTCQNPLNHLQHRIANSPVRSASADSKCFSRNLASRESVEMKSLQNEPDTKSAIVDLCFYILSVSKMMSIEKLCNRLCSCNVKSVQEYFSFNLFSEKLKFFKDLPQYFVISENNFVSLNKNIIRTYVPKTKLNPSEVFSDNISGSRSRSESISSDFSESRSVSSCGSRNNRRQHRRKKSQEPTKDVSRPYNAVKVSHKARSNVAATSVDSDNAVKNGFSDRKVQYSASSKNIIISRSVVNTDCVSRKETDCDEGPQKMVSKESLQTNAARAPKPSISYNKAKKDADITLQNNVESATIISKPKKSLKNELVLNGRTEDSAFQRECSKFQPTGDRPTNVEISQQAKAVEPLVSECTRSSFALRNGHNSEPAPVDIKFKRPRQPLQKNVKKFESSLPKASLKVTETSVNACASSDNFGKLINSNPLHGQTPISKCHISKDLPIVANPTESDAVPLATTVFYNSLYTQPMKAPISKGPTLKDLPIVVEPTESGAVTLNDDIFKNSKAGKTIASPLVTNNDFDCDILQKDISHEGYILELIDSFVRKLDSSVCGTSTVTGVSNDSNQKKNVLTVLNDNSDCDILKEVNADNTYVAELIDSFTGNLKLDSPPAYSASTVTGVSGNQNTQTLGNPHIFTSSCHTVPYVKDSTCNVPSKNPVTSSCYSVPTKVASEVTESNSDNHCTELRAINFFTHLLTDCSSGVPTKFLKVHLGMASSDIQTFMREHFKNDLLAFFQKHEKVFYVSPSSNVFLLQQPSPTS